MTNRIAKNVALAAGLILMLIGAGSFLPNPVVGPEGVIARYDYARYIDLLFGAALLAVSLIGEGTAAFGLYLIALFSGTFSGICYLKQDPSGAARISDTIRISGADMAFFALLALVLAAGASMNTSKKQLFYE